MASRRSRGKSRFKRRRAHAVLTKGRPGLLAQVASITGRPLYPHQKAAVEAVLHKGEMVLPATTTHMLSEVPKRAACPVCCKRQKVKRDGTMGRHDIDSGYEGDRTECAGTGRKWNEQS